MFYEVMMKYRIIYYIKPYQYPDAAIVRFDNYIQKTYIFEWKYVMFRMGSRRSTWCV